MLIVLAGCAEAAPAGGGPDGADQTPIYVFVRCGGEGLPTWYLDDYVFAGREQRAPIPKSCEATWREGTPGFTVTWTDDLGSWTEESPETGRFESGSDSGRPVFSSQGGVFVAGPGIYKMRVDVTDSEGRRGTGSASYEWAWRDPSHGLEVSIDREGSEAGSGDEISFTGDADGAGFLMFADDDDVVTQRFGANAGLLYAAYSGDVTAVWDFGDGSTFRDVLIPGREKFRFFDASSPEWDVDRVIDSRLIATHVYERAGEYEVTLTVTDAHFGRVGSATQRVYVEEPAASEPTPTAAAASLESSIRVDIHRVVGSAEPTFGAITGEITNNNPVRVRIYSMYLELSDGTRPNAAFLLTDVLEPEETTPFIEMYLNDGDLEPKTVLGVAEWRVQEASLPVDRTFGDQIEVSEIRINDTANFGGFQYYQVSVKLTNTSSNTVRINGHMVVRVDGEVVDLKTFRAGNDLAPGASQTAYMGTTVDPNPPAEIEFVANAICRDCS